MRVEENKGYVSNLQKQRTSNGRLSYAKVVRMNQKGVSAISRSVWHPQLPSLGQSNKNGMEFSVKESVLVMDDADDIAVNNLENGISNLGDEQPVNTVRDNDEVQ
ncbi:hypothetical protein Ancab_012330 [Ancistrocladus abbreviatus]